MREEEVYLIHKERVDKLAPSAFNPPNRVSTKNIADLVESMKAEGFRWYDPIKVTENMVIGDGHRRLAAALSLGIDKVPILIVRGKNASEIWEESENGKRSISGADVIQAASRGLSKIPRRHKSVMSQIVKLGGQELIEYMAKHNKSTGLFTQARAIACYCNMGDSDEFTLHTIHWLIDNNMTRMARFAMDLDIDRTRIILAIRDNRPLKIV